MTSAHQRLSTKLLLGLAWLGGFMWFTYAQAAVVIQYHHISNDTPKATSTSPAEFTEHLAYLKKSGYRVVPLPQLVQLLKAKESLPDKTVAITFDDGYESVYTTAFPLLKQYEFPFTIFVNTKPLQTASRQFVDWAQLREMANAGATIANHSVTHPHFLRRLANETDSAWRARMSAEILDAETLITEKTGQAHRILAYPYGEFDIAVRQLLRDLDFVGFGQQSGPLGKGMDLQSLPRFPFGGPYGNLDDFASKVSSLPLELIKIQVTDARGKPIEDTVLSKGTDQPSLELQLRNPRLAASLKCYASGQGEIQVTRTADSLFARAAKPLPVGRSRYNCTAPSAEPGRYYWYSQFFIRKKDDGSWYPES